MVKMTTIFDSHIAFAWMPIQFSNFQIFRFQAEDMVAAGAAVAGAVRAGDTEDGAVC